MRPLQVLIKGNRECNLRCAYCNDWRTASPTLSDARLEALFKATLSATGYDHCAYIWHGGEPLMLPVAFFQRAVELQSAQNSRGRRIVNAVQTNGTLVSHDWIDFFQQNGFSISLSLDGPPEIHDHTRPNAAGRSSYPMVQKGISLLRSRGIRFGVLFVVTERMLALGARRMWEFLQENEFTDVDFIAARPPNSPDGQVVAPTVSPQFTHMSGWCSFMCDLFDLWWEADSSISIRSLESVMSQVIGSDPEICILAGGCLGSVFAVEPSGLVTACDIFSGEEPFEFGPVETIDFDQITHSQRMHQINTWNQSRLAGLKDCEFFDRCQGGCPHNSVIYTERRVRSELDGCCGWAPLIRHIEARAGADLRAAQLLGGTHDLLAKA